ncbi:hypothetical protein JBE27_25445 [Streptomyces albiflaviniger]|nr:hypothetical protein [Streptomyces albiflaviniger]
MVQLRVRRYFCDRGSCSRRTFVEQVGGLTERHRRSSVELTGSLRSIAVEAGRVVDVLSDRTSETFAAWPARHPGAEIICRDRATAYTKAVKEAAPDRCTPPSPHTNSRDPGEPPTVVEPDPIASVTARLAVRRVLAVSRRLGQNRRAQRRDARSIRFQGGFPGLCLSGVNRELQGQ